jgi:triphosphoribosyl-dephospho-CoA synthase
MKPAIIAGLAVDALKAEALLTPKPGLVDRNGSGGHADMDLAMLLRSADALFVTFHDLAALGASQLDDQELRDRVGALGRIGEARMLDATGGVNTHRGSLWTLGLLVTAAASAHTEADIFTTAALIAQMPDSAGPLAQSSHGQRAVRTYGVSGAVGEAAAGFPHIANVALPELRRGFSRGDPADRAQLRALLALISTVDDTCILHRGGTDGLRWMKRSANQVVRARNFAHEADRFSRRADALRLSPGGSADLLSGALFIHALELARGQRNTVQEALHAHL